MEDRTIKRYEKRTILFHWVHAALFLVLLLTGLVMFLPIGVHSGGYAISILHRGVAVAFFASAVLHAISEPAKALRFIRETFTWDINDLRWFIAAPNYYFGGPAQKMPAQGHINTGQKIWQMIIIGTSPVFLVTGAIMWFFRSRIELNEYQWVLYAHGVAFVIVLVIFLVHLYMGLFHPRTRESLRSMLNGEVSESYARNQYRKWYEHMIDGQS